MTKDYRGAIALKCEIIHDSETFHTVQEMTHAVKDFFSKWNQIGRKLRFVHIN